MLPHPEKCPCKWLMAVHQGFGLRHHAAGHAWRQTRFVIFVKNSDDMADAPLHRLQQSMGCE